MRYRVLGTIAIAIATSLFIAPSASASSWTQLAPIVPAPAIPMIYTKGLAFDPGGGGVQAGVWVTDVGNDSPNDRAYKYALTPTTLLQTVGASPPGPDNLSYPGGIAVNPVNHDFYIADTSNNRILRYNAAGTRIGVNVASAGTIALSRPHGLKVVGSTLFIANSGLNGANRGVKRINLTLSSWGSDIVSNDFHTGPSDVAVDTAGGRVWTADEGDRAGEDDGAEDGSLGSVLRFNMSGVQQRRITKPEFGQPYSVEYDAAANVVYMGDYSKNIIFILSADTGEILDKMGTTSPVSPNTPVALSFDPASRILYVGQVGTKEFAGPGAREIERFQTAAPPSCSSTANVTTPFQAPVVVNFSCDGGSDTLRYEITSGPQHGNFGAPSNGGATRTYTPASGYSGNDEFAIRVVTKRGISPVKTVSITVGAPPLPTGPTGPTSPGGPTGPAPTVEPAAVFPPQKLSAAATLRAVRATKRGRSMIKITGQARVAAKNKSALPDGACSGQAALTVSVKQTRKTKSGKVTLLKTINSDSLKLRQSSGVCSAKFALSTAARHRRKSLVIKLSHPGNDIILPATGSFSVAPALK